MAVAELVLPLCQKGNTAGPDWVEAVSDAALSLSVFVCRCQNGTAAESDETEAVSDAALAVSGPVLCQKGTAAG